MSSLNGQRGSGVSHAEGADTEGALLRLRASLRLHAGRFFARAKPMRTGAGSLFAIAFIVSGLWAGALAGGQAPQIISALAYSVGLKAQDIVISGLIETREEDVLEALDLPPSRSLLGFDAGAARDRIAALPWVAHVSVRKLYPGRLMVDLREKRPFAVWQKDEHLSVVRDDGALITRFGISDLLENRFSNLPLLVGKGAPLAAHEILPLAAAHPVLSRRVRAYSRVGDRRWDIHFNNGTVARLPEHGLAAALDRLVTLQERDRVLDRQIASVDLRLPDRITLKLEKEAAAERAKFVEDRVKAMKKAEKNL